MSMVAQTRKNATSAILPSGKKLGAFALSEPEAGSDASNQRTRAVRDGDAYVLNGTKNWTTNGSTADLVLVMAATDRSKGPKGIRTFIVEKGMPGFAVAKKEKKLGIRSSDTVSLSFTDCRVPVANRIGEEGDGFKFAMKTLEGGESASRHRPWALHRLRWTPQSNMRKNGKHSDDRLPSCRRYSSRSRTWRRKLKQPACWS